MAFREVHAVVRLHCVLYHTIKGTILRRFGPKTIFGMNFYEFFSVALISASAILIYANLCLCNSCLYQLSKLQKVQNNAARLIFRTSRSAHASISSVATY